MPPPNKPSVHTTPGQTTEITVTTTGNCSGTTSCSTVTPDNGHKHFTFSGQAHFSGSDPHLCAITLKAEKHATVGFWQKLKRICRRAFQTTDSGQISVTLVSPSETPQPPVDVNYVS